MSERIGKELQETRQGLEISLEQAAEETRIRLRYLQALEQGDFNQLPSKAHLRGFLRSYADYLGIDSGRLLKKFEQLENPEQEIEVEIPSELLPEEPKDPQKSVSIFEDLGEQLRQRREMLGFSLEEVERNIHIRQHYLEALEAGNLDGLPSPVQGRGMLQNYAKFLGLDVDAILLKYADGLQAQLVERKAKKPVQSDTKPRSRRMSVPFSGIFPGEWILRAVLILVVLAFVIWGATRISSLRAAQTPAETVPPIVEALQSTPENDITAEPQLTNTPDQGISEPVNQPANDNVQIPPTEEVLPETPVPTISDAPIQVYISILRRAWMRVTVDGEVEFEGRVIPGSAYSFSGEFEIDLITGNGAGLQVFFNGTDLGILGVYGEVVYKVFTPEGVLLPTPTSTAVPTDTPQASPTPPVTNTP
ncbi:MAG: helix-turn-helix domain-containing protein [Anaerolineales bacterium]|jgi:cytoskeleton protein RodZ